MRQIEEDLVEAVRTGTAFKRKNTRYDAVTGIVYLHDNAIWQEPVGDDLAPSFRLAGWNTVTTRSRLNVLMDMFSVEHPYQAGVTTCQGQAQLILLKMRYPSKDTKLRVSTRWIIPIDDCDWIKLPVSWDEALLFAAGFDSAKCQVVHS